MISNYCKECVSFVRKECDGKVPVISYFTWWGRMVDKLFSGLRFCKRYEFSSKHWPKLSGDVKPDTIFHARERGRKKEVEQEVEKENVEAADDFDVGAGLSSKDFEHLLV